MDAARVMEVCGGDGSGIRVHDVKVPKISSKNYIMF